MGGIPMMPIYLSKGSSTYSPDNAKLDLTGYIGHWIFITGLNSDWDFENMDSKRNYVRIFSPFNNEPKYYDWNHFVKSLRAKRPHEVLTFFGIYIKRSQTQVDFKKILCNQR